MLLFITILLNNDNNAKVYKSYILLLLCLLRIVITS